MAISDIGKSVTFKSFFALCILRRKIYAAGLDAVRNEPIREDNPLLAAKNCFITPHISWTAVEGRQRLATFAIDNVKAFLNGNPTNVVNGL